MREDKKPCRHLNPYYLGPTHATLSVENGKVTSKHGVLIGHHHYQCKACGDSWCTPLWEVPMTINHEVAASPSPGMAAARS